MFCTDLRLKEKNSENCLILFVTRYAKRLSIYAKLITAVISWGREIEIEAVSRAFYFQMCTYCLDKLKGN